MGIPLDMPPKLIAPERPAFVMPAPAIIRPEEWWLANLPGAVPGLGLFAPGAGAILLVPGSGDWAGNTGSYTLTSGGVDCTAGNSAIYSTTDLTGDFTVLATQASSPDDHSFGVFDASETGSFPSSPSSGHWGASLTDSWWFRREDNVYYGSTDTTTAFTAAQNDVFRFRRVGDTITFDADTGSGFTQIHQFSQTFSGAVRVGLGSGSSASDMDTMSFTYNE